MTTDENDGAGMGGIRMGVNVDIKRTDGRIHSAVVSGINVETKSVTVEWFERGETKVMRIFLGPLATFSKLIFETTLY